MFYQLSASVVKVEKRWEKGARNLAVLDRAETRGEERGIRQWRLAQHGLGRLTRQRRHGLASLGAYPALAVGSAMAQKMHYRGHPRPFCKHSLPGAPQAVRTGGIEEAATSKVGEGKHCPLWPCQESLPSNCPREETRLRTLSWLVTKLPAPKCPSCPLIFPRAPV